MEEELRTMKGCWFLWDFGGVGSKNHEGLLVLLKNLGVGAKNHGGLLAFMRFWEEARTMDGR